MIKVACVAPCIGLGGADALMMGLIKYAFNLDFTGIYVSGDITKSYYETYQKCLRGTIPLYQRDIHTQRHPGITYTANPIEAVCADADIVFTWGEPGVDIEGLPVIEYAQNTDDKAAKVCESNKHSTQYKVACCQAARMCFGIDPLNVSVIYNGIDPCRLTPRKGRKLQRHVWDIEPDKKVLLYMGRLVEEKHPELALQALQYLTDEWMVIFVGDGDMRDDLFTSAKRFFPNRVAFIKPEYHVGDILAAADCFILPSDYEGHPLALMEAMFVGIPCVYTDFEVMQEFRQLGVMIPKRASGDICAEAVLKAVHDDNFIQVNTARQFVWEHFTLPTIAHQWEQYIESCLFDWYRVKRMTPIYKVSNEL